MPLLDFDGADVARAKVPIENVVRFKTWLEGSISGRTVPAHSGVQNHAIELADGKGFVATLIPKSEMASLNSKSSYPHYRNSEQFLRCLPQ